MGGCLSRGAAAKTPAPVEAGSVGRPISRRAVTLPPELCGVVKDYIYGPRLTYAALSARDQEKFDATLARVAEKLLRIQCHSTQRDREPRRAGTGVVQNHPLVQ